MSLRLLPAVDIRDGRAVRLVQGKADAETVSDDDPVTSTASWSAICSRSMRIRRDSHQVTGWWNRSASIAFCSRWTR